MIKYLLDTNAVIGLLKGQRTLSERARRHSPSDMAVSSVVMHELFYGAFKSVHQPSTLNRADQLSFEVVDFDRADARAAGEVRAALERLGKPIGAFNTLIAGQAVARGLTLVTRNTREFSRVPDLRCENWES